MQCSRHHKQQEKHLIASFDSVFSLCRVVTPSM